jgi:hypothetical protein
MIPFLGSWGAAVSRLLSRIVGAAYTFISLRRAMNAAPADGEQ